MSLDATALKNARKTAILAIPGINVTNEEELEKFLQADSEAIISYLKSATVVTVNGVQSGGSNATGGIS